MKKLILIAGLLISSKAFPQAGYPFINIWGVEDTVVAQGDSLYVDFTYAQPYFPPISDTCFVELLSSLSVDMVYLWRGYYHDLDTLPRFLIPVQSDSVTRMYVHIPANFHLGMAGLYTTGGFATWNIRISPGPTIISDLSAQKEIVSRRYYSLLGKEILGPSGEVVIEEIIYRDGSSFRHKILKQ